MWNPQLLGTPELLKPQFVHYNNLRRLPGNQARTARYVKTLTLQYEISNLLLTHYITILTPLFVPRNRWTL